MYDSPDISLIGGISYEHSLYLKKIKLRKYLVLLAQLTILVAFFLLWEAAATMKWIDSFIFSQPTRIVRAAAAMIRDGSIFKHIGVTLGETVIGFVLSTVIGTLISVLLWWNKFSQRVLNPYLVVLNSLPKTALAPIIIVWLGNNVKSVIATAIMTSIIVTIITVLSGFNEVSKDKIKLVETFGGTKRQVLFMVALPASVPSIISALKINVGLTFVGVIVGEFLVANAGLGYLIVYGSQIFKMDWVMMSVRTLAVIIIPTLASLPRRRTFLFFSQNQCTFINFYVMLQYTLQHFYNINGDGFLFPKQSVFPYL